MAEAQEQEVTSTICKECDLSEAIQELKNTMLMSAASRGHVDCVASILRAGADVNTRDQSGGTPLMRAAKAGHEQFVNVLIETGADVNMTDKRGFTSLMYAAYRGHHGTAVVITKAGADVNVQSTRGETAFDAGSEVRS